MTYDRSDSEDTDLDLLDARMRELFLRRASVRSDKAAASIWNAMQSELRQDDGNAQAVGAIGGSTSKNWFSYRGVLTLAAVGLFVSFSSMLLVALKQRSDGTVLSTVTHLERMMNHDRIRHDAQLEFLPEERQILRQLVLQTADRIEPSSSLEVGPVFQH